MAIVPVATTATFLGFAKEATPGTAVAATAFMPVKMGLTPHELKHYQPDEGLRGSYVKTYAEIPTQGWSEISFSGDLFVDVAGNIYKGLLGDEGSTATAGSGTTLAALSAVGATSVSITADPGASTTIQIDTGVAAETRTITSKSGAGPYTVNFAGGLERAHSNGATVKYGVTAPYSHAFAVQNGGQPPTFTITDYNGLPTAITGHTRQYPFGMFSELTVKGQADQLVTYSAKALAFASATASKPTQSFSSVAPKAAYLGTVTLAGSGTSLVENFELTLKRDVNAVLGVNGSTSPTTIFGASVEGSGKFTFIYPNDGTAETIYGYYLAGTSVSFDYTLTTGATTTTQTYEHHASSLLLTDAQIKRDKSYVQLDATAELVANTTDVGASGGYGPSVVTLQNAVVANY